MLRRSLTIERHQLAYLPRPHHPKCRPAQHGHAGPFLQRPFKRNHWVSIIQPSPISTLILSTTEQKQANEIRCLLALEFKRLPLERMRLGIQHPLVQTHQIWRTENQVEVLQRLALQEDIFC